MAKVHTKHVKGWQSTSPVLIQVVPFLLTGGKSKNSLCNKYFSCLFPAIDTDPIKSGASFVIAGDR